MFWEKERSWVTRPKFPIYSKALYSFWDPYWLVFVAPQFMLHWRHYVFVLSVMWQRYLFHFTSMLNEYRWNSQDVITTMSKLNSYILGKIGTEVREQDTRKIWIDVNQFYHSVKQVLTPTEWIHKIHCTSDGTCDCRHSFMSF